MALARRKKGFRLLTVAGVEYRWRLQTGRLASRVTIYGPSGALLVELPEWTDPWLNLDGFTVNGPTLQLSSSSRNTPSLITSAFARRAILAALRAGWNPAAKKKTSMVYRNDDFTCPD